MVKLKPVRGISSVGERLIHIQEATGSKPVCPTISNKQDSRGFESLFLYIDILNVNQEAIRSKVFDGRIEKIKFEKMLFSMV